MILWAGCSPNWQLESVETHGHWDSERREKQKEERNITDALDWSNTKGIRSSPCGAGPWGVEEHCSSGLLEWRSRFSAMRQTLKKDRLIRAGCLQVLYKPDGQPVRQLVREAHGSVDKGRGPRGGANQVSRKPQRGHQHNGSPQTWNTSQLINLLIFIVLSSLFVA